LERGAGEENPFLWGQAGHQRHEEGQIPRSCTAQGEAHRHYFKVCALDTPRDLKAGATKKELLAAIKDHILEEGTLMGKYRR
jgi:phosphatidylethanolamine-binding protein (PEBP) family uncharacterized protein